MTDLVSIIIPCYNGAAYISETIHSVLNQSHQNFEIIVVNDGSTDDSLEVIKTIHDDRIQILDQQNQGVSAARNNGMQMAKGAYIVFLDADDLLSHNFVTERVAFLKGQKAFAAAGGRVILIDENSHPITSDETILASHTIENIQNFETNRYTCPASYLYNLSFLKNHGIQFNTQLQSSADRFFIYEVMEKAQVGMVDAPMIYRILPNSMSHGVSENLWKDQKSYIQEISSKPLGKDAEYMSRLYYTLSGSSYHLNKKGEMILCLMKSFLLSPRTCLNLLKKNA